MRCAYVFVGCVSGWHWEYHTLSVHWEYGYSQRQHQEHHTLSAACWEYDTLSAVWSCYYNISGGYKKNKNWQYWWLPIKNFCQQRLNGAADQPAAKGGQVLPQFQHIVSGALMLPCPIAAVFLFLCEQSSVVGHWLLVVGCWSVSQSTIRVAGL